MRKVLAIRHVEIEHLGILEDIFKSLGFAYEYLDTFRGFRLREELESYQGLVVLGGYMGAYEEEKYDFLSYEFKLIEEALKRDLPFLGICLGAQMLAKVLGARVYPGDKGKEIGWLSVKRVSDHFYFEGCPYQMRVFQWHGDTFDLPQGSLHLFASERYENQGFVFGKAVGLQFHLEVDRSIAGRWAEVYRSELLEEGVSPGDFLLLSDSENEIIHQVARSFLARWLIYEKVS